MARHERKPDNGGALKPVGRPGQQRTQPSDERFQRSLLLLLLVSLLTFIIVPKGVLTTTSFAPGDVAPRDIKAPHDILIPDQALTEQKRLEAGRTLPVFYDFDPGSARTVNERLRQALALLRSAAGDGAEAPGEAAARRLLTTLENDFAVKVTARTLPGLRALAGVEGIDSLLVATVNNLYAVKVSGNLDLFEADRGRGVLFRDVVSQAEKVAEDDEVVVDLEQLRARLKKALAASELSTAQRKAASLLIGPLLRPNISFNQNETEARRQTAIESVKPVMALIKKGEMVVREGDRVTPDQIERLAAMRDDGSAVALWRNAMGLLLSSSLLIYLCHAFARRNIRKYRPANRDLLFMTAVFVVHILVLKVAIFISTALGGAFSYIDQGAYYYVFPFAVGTMLVRIVLNSEIALVFALLSAIITGILFGNSFAIMLFAFMTSVAGAHWLRHLTERSSLFRAGLRLGLFNCVMLFALHLMTARAFDLQLLLKLGFGLAGGLVAAVIVTGVIPLVESLFRYTTNIKLLELANMNNPLLRDLMVQAPGTYHHSVIVGNLAEAAAETIGVNPLLVRVAAYYHDIGKIRKPLYFIENLGGQENRHNKLAPSMSALILAAHVKDAVEMARENRLGSAITDIIRQHHGTSLMKFFYDKARSKADPGVEHIDERDYRYSGPKPQTREAALIMLADAIEAASRTLTNPTRARIQGMVQKIINNIFIDGQLDECELTLKDIHNIAKSFNLVLGGIFHYRVDYPEPVSKERSAERQPKNSDEDRDRKPSNEAEDKEAAPAQGSTEDLKRLGMS
jgi:putative nucleotidyltransferase with HDIG domain